MELSEILVYLIKVIAIQGVFFLFYWLVLHNRISHALNRVYLLATLLGAFVIPFLIIPVATISQPLIESDMFVWIAVPIGEVQSNAVISKVSFPLWSIITWLYFGLAAFFLGRSSFYLIILQNLKRHSEYIKKQWFRIFKISHSRPFSFFSSVLFQEIFLVLSHSIRLWPMSVCMCGSCIRWIGCLWISLLLCFGSIPSSICTEEHSSKFMNIRRMRML